MPIWTKIKALISSDEPLLNLAKFIVLFIVGVFGLIFYSNVSTSQDLQWYSSAFTDLPNRLALYKGGQLTTWVPGQPGFQPLAEAVRASLAGGVQDHSNIGLSDSSQQEAFDKYTTLVAFFPYPVKVHAWFFTGHPTQMLFPITGRHSEQPIVFLGENGDYLADAPVLKNNTPLLQELKALGYLD